MTASENVLETYWSLDRASLEAAGLTLLMDIARRSVEADEASLLVLDAETGDLVFVKTVGASDDVLRGQRVPASEGLVGLAMATGEVQVGAPKYRDLQQSGSVGVDGHPAWVLAAPILLGEEPIGVLTAVRFDAAADFDLDDVAMIGRIGGLAGVIVNLNARVAARSAALGERDAQNRRLADAFAALMAQCADRPAELEVVLAAIGKLVERRA